MSPPVKCEIQVEYSMFTFAASPPRGTPAVVWAIQQTLVAEAEKRFGPRESTKQIFQPTFGVGGPILINTPTSDGAFAMLSEAAAVYWPTLVFELAHETVHLLNPINGFTNYLEEGVAVVFAAEMSSLTAHPQNTNVLGYVTALGLVSKLPAPFASSIRLIREQIGALSHADAAAIAELFPGLDADVCRRLCLQCNPRSPQTPDMW